MNPVESIQGQIVTEFQEIGDDFDQYAYLIELSCGFQPMRAEDKTEEGLVKGCQSHVWLKTGRDDQSMFTFSADSDTLIVKGILRLLQRMFCGQSPADVADIKVTFLQDTAIMETFTGDRQKGIGYVIQSLQQAARNMDDNKDG